MSGTITLGGKTLASHSNDTDVMTVGDSFTSLIEVDQWYLTANKGDANPVIDWARNNFTGFAKIGTGLTETATNSGIFKFPKNGVYEITLHAMFRYGDTSDHTVEIDMMISSDNGANYTTYGRTLEGLPSASQQGQASTSFILNVTNYSNFVFKFITNSLSGSNYMHGSTTVIHTNFVIKRLGPAQ